MERGQPDNDHAVSATQRRADVQRPPQPTRTAVLTGRPGDRIRTIEMAPHRNFGSHRHDTAQLVWPHAGAMRVICDDRSWILVPGAAVWIPSGTPHDVVADSSGCTFRSLYLHEPGGHGHDPAIHWLSAAQQPFATPTPLQLDQLLLDIIGELDLGQPSDRNERARLELVMFDRLRRRLSSPTWHGGTPPLPFPRDERARRIAASLLERVDDGRDLDAWGRTVGASARTLRRLWRSETGLTFRQWRTSVRLQRAYRLVLDGVPMNDVARSVGYTNQSAFSEAFTAHHGLRPSGVRQQQNRR